MWSNCQSDYRSMVHPMSMSRLQPTVLLKKKKHPCIGGILNRKKVIMKE